MGMYGPEVAVPADARFVLSAGGDGCLSVWDSGTGDCLKRLPGHKGPVLALCVTLDGRYALSGGEDDGARLWDLGAAYPTAALGGHESSVTGVAISADGRHVALAARSQKGPARLTVGRTTAGRV